MKIPKTIVEDTEFTAKLGRVQRDLQHVYPLMAAGVCQLKQKRCERVSVENGQSQAGKEPADGIRERNDQRVAGRLRVAAHLDHHASRPIREESGPSRFFFLLSMRRRRPHPEHRLLDDPEGDRPEHDADGEVLRAGAVCANPVREEDAVSERRGRDAQTVRLHSLAHASHDLRDHEELDARHDGADGEAGEEGARAGECDHLPRRERHHHQGKEEKSR